VTEKVNESLQNPESKKGFEIMATKNLTPPIVAVVNRNKRYRQSVLWVYFSTLLPCGAKCAFSTALVPCEFRFVARSVKGEHGLTNILEDNSFQSYFVNFKTQN